MFLVGCGFRVLSRGGGDFAGCGSHGFLVDSDLLLRWFGCGGCTCESALFGCVGWRDALHAHYSEEYQAEYLETVCREVMTNPGILGVSLWQFCDCRTYAGAMALGRPRTFNNKGTFDEYRRPKQAAQVVKAAFG